MNLQIPGLYLLLGRQGSGKSYLLQYLMYQFRKKFKYGIVFTNTFFDNDPFPYIPKEYVHPEYSEEALDNLMKIQERAVGEGKIREAFVIFDDCLDGDQFKSLSLKKLSVQLRHYHITVFLSSQYTNLLPPRFRTNAMGVFIFHDDTKINLESLFESFGQRFDSYIEFKNFILKNLKKKHTFMYYDKMDATQTDINKIFKILICPEKIPKFSIKY